MIFGTIPLSEAVGSILAHATRHKDGLFRKGRVLSADDVEALRTAGHQSVIAAKLGPHDVPEDEAARLVSREACGTGAKPQEPFTGRANLYATAKGLLVMDEKRLSAINHLHESLTIATLPNYSLVEPRQMVATIKVIPFAVPREVLDKALAFLSAAPLLHVAPFKPKRAGLIITRLPQTKSSILVKSETAIRDRLEAMGASLIQVSICHHAVADVSAVIAQHKTQGCDPILVLGASAIVDRADVIPSAVVQSGGKVLHLGIPVDPGNLLMLAALDHVPVIGVPSCARSRKVNGFDWVLERLIADVPVTPSDLMDMGVGGLLAEIPSRPSPREGKGAIPTAPKITAIVLAAGTSSRMGTNKLLADFRGEPMIRAVVCNVRASAVDDVIVVAGHDKGKVISALSGSGVQIVSNPDFEQGLATSLRAGVVAAKSADALVVCLGDMPLVKPQTIDRLIAAFDPTEHRTIIVPTHKGQLGNPVLWGREHFPKLMALEGDRGARSLIAELKSEAVEIAVDDPGILADADTPEALTEMQRS